MAARKSPERHQTSVLSALRPELSSFGDLQAPPSPDLTEQQLEGLQARRPWKKKPQLKKP
jgi:hypothetical protein